VVSVIAAKTTILPRPAHVIVETDVHDPEQYDRYKAASPGAVHAGGGRFVARGGELAVQGLDEPL